MEMEKAFGDAIRTILMMDGVGTDAYPEDAFLAFGRIMANVARQFGASDAHSGQGPL